MHKPATPGILPAVKTPSTHAQFRAALIALVLFTQAVMAIPAVQPVTRETLRGAGARAELHTWFLFLQGLGMPGTQREFSDRLERVTVYAFDARAMVNQPLKALSRELGIHQSWGLFAAPGTYPNLLVVEIQRPGQDWETVYRRLDPEYDEMSATLAYRRVRGLYDSGGPNKPYRNFAQWTARQVFAEHPEATRMSIKLIQLHTTLPNEPADNSQKVRRKTIIRRDEVLP